jgi:hypothetical protein
MDDADLSPSQEVRPGHLVVRSKAACRSHDMEIATESRRHTASPPPHKAVPWNSIGGRLVRTRVLLVGGLSLVVVGVFGAGYTLRDLANGITEAPSHWWSTAPWIGIVLGIGLLVLARMVSHRRPTAS